jgi:hypothetical protein
MQQIIRGRDIYAPQAVPEGQPVAGTQP